MEFQSFLIGFVVCMIGYVFFSISNYFIRRAFYFRSRKKYFDVKLKEFDCNNSFNCDVLVSENCVYSPCNRFNELNKIYPQFEKITKRQRINKKNESEF